MGICGTKKKIFNSNLADPTPGKNNLILEEKKRKKHIEKRKTSKKNNVHTFL